jgi:hypothetical protein
MIINIKQISPTFSFLYQEELSKIYLYVIINFYKLNDTI